MPFNTDIVPITADETAKLQKLLDQGWTAIKMRSNGRDTLILNAPRRGGDRPTLFTNVDKRREREAK